MGGLGYAGAEIRKEIYMNEYIKKWIRADHPISWPLPAAQTADSWASFSSWISTAPDVAALAGLLSLLTSVAGLPEVEA